METFLSILLLIVIGIPWLLLTWKIYRLWCANTTTISFNGASGLFDAHFGYIIMSGLLAAAIIIVPIYLIVYVFTGLSELILHHYIITALLIILSIIIALEGS